MDGSLVASSEPVDGPLASSLPKPRKQPKIPPLNMQLVAMGLTVADVLQGRKQVAVAAEMNLAAQRANRIAAQRIKAQRAAQNAVSEQKASKLVVVQNLDRDKRERLQQFRLMNSRRPQSQLSNRVESTSRSSKASTPLATGHSNRKPTGHSSHHAHTDRHLNHHGNASKQASTMASTRRPARRTTMPAVREL